MGASESAPEGDTRVGTTIGGYEVSRFVADGAMGRVYEATHPDTGERVAIKVLHPKVAKDAIAVERFKREYETAQEFEHPNIVRVLDFGDVEDPKSWFMTMEFLDGEEMGDVLSRDGGLSSARAVRIGAQMALALDEAHGYGVIHRDLKPGNVFLCSSDDGDQVRLLDFGAVKLQMATDGPKLTTFGTTLGSPYYMSPEQAMGKQDVDTRTDLFAFAAILFEMLTGQIAFNGRNVSEILMQIVNGNPPLVSEVNSSVPPALDSVIERGIRKEKEERYSTALELGEDFVKAFGFSEGVTVVAGLSLGEIEERLKNPAPQTAVPDVTDVESAPTKEPKEAESPAAAAPITPAEHHPPAVSTNGAFIILGLGLLGVMLGALVVAAFLLF